MGASPSKEEVAVLKFLLHILSTRGLSYDLSTLKALLIWACDKKLIPTIETAYAQDTWSKIGAVLWDEVSEGSKEAVKFSTAWRLISETLTEMQAERRAAAAAFMALSPEKETNPTGLSFGEPPGIVAPQPRERPVPVAIPKVLPKEEPVPVGEAEGFPPPPATEGGEEASEELQQNPTAELPLYPPLPPSPSSSSTEGGGGGLKDHQFWELIKKLEVLEARLDAQSVNPPPAYPPPMHGASGIDGHGGDERGGNGFQNRWKGVIKKAVGEGVFLEAAAYPVFTTPAGQAAWEPLDWKILKETKQAVTQYGLTSPYMRALIEHLLTANLLTPYDSKQIVQMLLGPSQRLQFLSTGQQLCDQAAAEPRPQGDPLQGVQTQMLMGSGPFVRADWQATFTVPVLQLSQQLAQKALLGIREEKTVPAFMSIRQGLTESYSQFIDRLHTAISGHPDLDKTMKAKFLDLLAFDNANDQTKKALSTLPRGSTTAQLLETAERVLANSKATVMTAAVGAAVRPLIQKKGKGKQDKRCYNCKKSGHFRKEYRSAGQRQQQKMVQ
ncbi:endogenous retrovirus group K member 5 Gag polyprotein-like [Gavia stellata]|uniref:endogenous retrovirus group K member 5 Gag polyprotein-like n=1 Tax=Gavia stellata TaxID=37040 RepID=UPI0028989EE3|nr:endogenous retrovirus group K member 5 Gag polyprotein-like [Gavia stellata]